MGSAWRHAVCERCWIKKRSNLDALGRAVSIDRMPLVKDPELENCCHCGQPTIIGCYLRGDANKLLCLATPGWGPVHAR